MKISLLYIALITISLLVSCDVQSGITKKSVEKYGPTPTPNVSPTPTEEPIDPADVVQVDTAVQGPTLTVNSTTNKKTHVCDKYNRVMVNGGNMVVILKGACSQIMLNGDGNDVTLEAVAEIVYNGADNKVRYSRYANGKRPVINQTKGGNLSEKVPAPVKK
jgi:hypothetical protein